MGALTATTIDTDVRALLGTPSTDLLPTATQLRFTNAAYIDDVVLNYDCLELRQATTTNATVNVRAYTPTISNLLRLRSIQNAAGQVLKEITPEIESRYSAPIAALTSSAAAMTGLPTHYIRVGGAAYSTFTVNLYPVPDAAYPLTVFFVSRPAELSASTATTIDAVWDQSILHYAASRAAAFLRNYDDAMKLREYASTLAKAVAKSLALSVTEADNAAPPAGSD